METLVVTSLLPIFQYCSIQQYGVEEANNFSGIVQKSKQSQELKDVVWKICPSFTVNNFTAHLKSTKQAKSSKYTVNILWIHKLFMVPQINLRR